MMFRIAHNIGMAWVLYEVTVYSFTHATLERYYQVFDPGEEDPAKTKIVTVEHLFPTESGLLLCPPLRFFL